MEPFKMGSQGNEFLGGGKLAQRLKMTMRKIGDNDDGVNSDIGYGNHNDNFIRPSVQSTYRF